MESLKLVYCEWLDIHTRDGWSDLAEEDLEPEATRLFERKQQARFHPQL